MKFKETLTEAVRDMVNHGYDDQRRVDDWMRRLRESAEAELMSPKEIERRMKGALDMFYRRSLSKTHLKKRHPNVSRFMIDRIIPELRPELTKRILASTDLIKLHRVQAVDKTLQRFSGWATSIPEGGSRVVDKVDVKDSIGKSMKQLKYEERRLEIDQGHKLMASVDAVIAQQTNAIAGIWRDHGSVDPTYDARHSHMQRDGKVYAVRGNWAMEKGLMNKGYGYLDEMTAPGEEVYCFPGDSVVPFADGVEVAYRRWYDGEMVELITRSGETLRGTPNHPILTMDGWVPLGALDVGNNVLKRVENVINPSVAAHDDNGAVTTIAHIFGAVMRAGFSEKRSGKPENFHGDGSASDIDTVWATRPLRFGVKPMTDEGGKDFSFAHANNASAAFGSFYLFFHRCLSSLAGAMSSLSTSSMLFGGFVGRNKDIGSMSPTNFASSRFYGFDNARPRDSFFFGQRKNTLPGFMGAPKNQSIKGLDDIFVRSVSQLDESHIPSLVKSGEGNAKAVSDFSEALPFATQADEIVSINRVNFSGHVYNLQTVNGWYVTGNIIAHNCGCYVTYIHNLRDLPAYMLTAKGKKVLEETRVA